MSEAKALVKQPRLELIQQSAGYAALESTAEYNGVLNVANLSTVERSMMTAQAISAIRKALSDDVMREWVMPLMNTKVGFDTDHNKSKGWTGEEYPLATVRECCIEAILHGLPLVGNAWNIIAGGMYVRKEGFEGLLSGRVRFTRTVNIDPSEAKRAAAEKGGGYCRGSVTIHHKGPTKSADDPAETFKGSYNVRVNANNKVPVEASEGKALRKAYRDLWQQLTGALVPEGETSDVFELDDTPNGSAPDTSPSAPPPSPSAPPPSASPPGGQALEAELAAPDDEADPPTADPPSIAKLRDALKVNPVTLKEAAAAMAPPIEFDDGIVPAAMHIPEARRQECIEVVFSRAKKSPTGRSGG